MTKKYISETDYDIGILVLGFTRPDFLKAAIQSLRYIQFTASLTGNDPECLLTKYQII